jgi:hypothetical protein
MQVPVGYAIQDDILSGVKVYKRRHRGNHDLIEQVIEEDEDETDVMADYLAEKQAIESFRNAPQKHHDSLLTDSNDKTASQTRNAKSDMAFPAMRVENPKDSTNASDIGKLASPTAYSQARGSGFEMGLLSQSGVDSKEFSVAMTPKPHALGNVSPRVEEIRRIKHSQMPNSVRNTDVSGAAVFTPSQGLSQWTWGGAGAVLPTPKDTNAGAKTAQISDRA